MAFPKNLVELKAAGYRFDNHTECKFCAVVIEWWTTPAGKKIPMDIDEKGNAQAHFANCKPYAERHRASTRARAQQ